MRLTEAKRLYQGEWIAFHVKDDVEDPDGEVILHNKDRRAFDRRLLELELTDLYISFAGPAVPDGYAAIF